MEAEIKQALVTTLARQMGTLSPRMFLTTMAPVICREPTVFMQAAAAVCQVEKVNGRQTVVLKENKEKVDKVSIESHASRASVLDVIESSSCWCPILAGVSEKTLGMLWDRFALSSWVSSSSLVVDCKV